MTTKYGDFIPPVFHTIGDPYKNINSKTQNLYSCVPHELYSDVRLSQNNDACFDKVKILYEGERYVDPSRQKLLANAEKRKNVITDLPFKGPSPMKLSVGLGDCYGTFQGKVPYIAGSPVVPVEKGFIPDGKPNLYSSPGKKGSYGFIKTTLSEHKRVGGAQGEYQYIADPYNRSKVLEAAARAKVQRVTDAPFVPSNPPRKGGSGYIKTTIGNKAHGIAGEYQYKPCGPVSGTALGAKVETAFVPPRAPKKGYNCTFSKYPAYAADPEHLKSAAQQQPRKLSQQKMSSTSWSPAQIPKSGATRSVVRMNI